MKVINVKGMPANAPGIVYCGREWAGWKASPLANLHRTKIPCRVNRCCVLRSPYGGRPIGPVHTREEAIECFRQDLHTWFQTWSVVGEDSFSHGWRAWDAINALTEESVLGCWCKPLPCHCDVIVRAWRWFKLR